MRNLTIQDLFKILPIDDTVRKELQKDYESYPAGKKTSILHNCWKAFHTMFEAMQNSAYDQVLTEIAEGKHEKEKDPMEIVDTRVWKDIDDMLAGVKTEKDELEKIRTQLQSLLTASSQ